MPAGASPPAWRARPRGRVPGTPGGPRGRPSRRSPCPPNASAAPVGRSVTGRDPSGPAAAARAGSADHGPALYPAGVSLSGTWSCGLRGLRRTCRARIYGVRGGEMRSSRASPGSMAEAVTSAEEAGTGGGHRRRRSDLSTSARRGPPTCRAGQEPETDRRRRAPRTRMLSAASRRPDAQVRTAARRLLPGVRYRRRVLRRYSLTSVKPALWMKGPGASSPTSHCGTPTARRLHPSADCRIPRHDSAAGSVGGSDGVLPR